MNQPKTNRIVWRRSCRKNNKWLRGSIWWRWRSPSWKRRFGIRSPNCINLRVKWHKTTYRYWSSSIIAIRSSSASLKRRQRNTKKGWRHLNRKKNSFKIVIKMKYQKPRGMRLCRSCNCSDRDSMKGSRNSRKTKKPLRKLSQNECFTSNGKISIWSSRNSNRKRQQKCNSRLGGSNKPTLKGFVSTKENMKNCYSDKKNNELIN